MKYPIADAHCDRLGNAASQPDVTRQRLREGNVAFQLFALFCGSRGQDPYAFARRQYQEFVRLVEAGDIEKTTRAFLPQEGTAGMLSIEGGEILQGSVERLHEFYDLGVRAVALTWNYPNEIGNPAKLDGEGLTTVGTSLVKEMNRLHIAVDVSHLSDAGFWDVEKLCGPFMASHSNARDICGHFRNLTDDQICAIIDHGGFIGINFYPPFLSRGDTAQIEDILRHIDYILNLGGENVLGFGSDFDGIEIKVEGLEHPGHFPRLMQALEKQGYPAKLLRKIAGENLVSFFKGL